MLMTWRFYILETGLMIKVIVVEWLQRRVQAYASGFPKNNEQK